CSATCAKPPNGDVLDCRSYGHALPQKTETTFLFRRDADSRERCNCRRHDVRAVHERALGAALLPGAIADCTGGNGTLESGTCTRVVCGHRRPEIPGRIPRDALGAEEGAGATARAGDGQSGTTGALHAGGSERGDADAHSAGGDRAEGFGGIVAAGAGEADQRDRGTGVRDGADHGPDRRNGEPAAGKKAGCNVDGVRRDPGVDLRNPGAGGIAAEAALQAAGGGTSRAASGGTE